MNSTGNKEVVNYVINRIHGLLDNVEVILDKKEPLNYCFYIPSCKLEISFSRAIMEDFQAAIEEYKDSDQYRGLENFIKFRIYTVLGKAGLIPKFLVSNEFLRERREWLQNYNGKFEKPAWLYDVFYEGLKTLSSFLTDLVAKYKVSSDDIKQEQEDIKFLIDFYDKHHHFSDAGVSVSSLGYFKAAAVCAILDKEMDNKSIIAPRILKARNQEIYSIVSEMRENPFPQIKMPDCIYDYAEYVKAEKNVSKSKKLPAKKLIFVACGQSTAEEKTLGMRVKNLLKRHNIDSFLAEMANDLESLNSHIFQNLTDCTGFIAILHKRDKGYDTSVWINQEVAITAYLRSINRVIPSLVLYEEGATIEGLIKYTIANPLVFRLEEEALTKIENWITRQNFTHKQNLPEFDIILSEEHKQFGSSLGGGKEGYFNIRYALSFRIRNKSNINICLEDVGIENELLGKGKLDKSNLHLASLPFNIGPRMTEELYLLFKFPNEVDVNMKDKDIVLQIEFEFSDRVVTKELACCLQ